MISKIARIAVAFSRAEATMLEDRLREHGVLIIGEAGDAHTSTGVRRAPAQLDSNAEREIAGQVRTLFESLEVATNNDALRGFANNFFECTVAPLAAYITILDDALTSARDRHTPVEVWFASRQIIRQRTSAYYMAEHESQGTRFYSRAAVFLPYLLDVCKRHGASVRFLGTEVQGRAPFYRAARIASVLAVRVGGSIRAKRRRSSTPETTDVSSSASATSPDVFAVTRSPAQTNFLEPFLRTSGLSSLLVGAEIFVGGGRNTRAVSALAKLAPAVGTRMLNEPSWRALAADYAKALPYMVRPPRARLAIRGVELRLEQAVAEVFVMLPDLLAYRRGLESIFARSEPPRTRLVLSTEQKSPYAFADAWAARRAGLACAHLMQCDQHSRPLPYPVYGEFFLADSLAKQASLAEAFGNEGHKVRYVGSMKACVGAGPGPDEEPPVQRWCFFTQPMEPEANAVALDALLNSAPSDGQGPLVKLHPRDRHSLYASNPAIEIVRDGEIRQEELFAQFSSAVTFPSGIVLDLLFRRKPFVLICFGPGANAREYHYFDKAYRGNAHSPAELAELLRDERALAEAFVEYREQFLRRHSIISDVAVIRDGILRLVHERDGWTPTADVVSPTPKVG